LAERTTPGTRTALTIAGSDCSGGGGIQADLKTFSVMGVYGASVVTAVAAANSTGIKAVHILDPDLVEQQIAAVATDLDAHAVKSGMLGNANVIRVTATSVKRHNLFPLVVDPQIVGCNGDRLLDDSALKMLCRQVLPLAAVVTPNRLEAALLLGASEPIDDLYAARDAARQLCSRYGPAACIVTGIKRPNEEEGEAVDLFFDGRADQELVSAWRPTKNTRGAGSTFSAAITAALAMGEPIEQAVQTAKQVVSEAIRQTTDLGHGPSPVNPLAYSKVS